jgi:hypothetical protein
MNLKEGNRWVKKAQTIPWLEIEKRYAALFKNRKGNVEKPLRLALGARIIQVEYGFSDEEVALMIQEHPYLQYFCGYSGYDDSKLPFTPEILGEINELILAQQEADKIEDKDDKDEDDNDNDNRGTMIVARPVHHRRSNILRIRHCSTMRVRVQKNSLARCTRRVRKSHAPIASAPAKTTSPLPELASPVPRRFAKPSASN